LEFFLAEIWENQHSSCIAWVFTDHFTLMPTTTAWVFSTAHIQPWAQLQAYPQDTHICTHASDSSAHKDPKCSCVCTVHIMSPRKTSELPCFLKICLNSYLRRICVHFRDICLRAKWNPNCRSLQEVKGVVFVQACMCVSINHISILIWTDNQMLA
jgi:hypothetical protein